MCSFQDPSLSPVWTQAGIQSTATPSWQVPAEQSWLQHFLGRATFHASEAVVTCETALPEHSFMKVWGSAAWILHRAVMINSSPHHNWSRENAVHLVMWQVGSVWKVVFNHALYQQEEPITSLGKEMLLYPCGQEDQQPDYISLFEWTPWTHHATPCLYSQRLNFKLELLMLTWNGCSKQSSGRISTVVGLRYHLN